MKVLLIVITGALLAAILLLHRKPESDPYVAMPQEEKNRPSPPEVNQVGVTFVEALAKSESEKAWEMLSEDLKQKWTPLSLQEHFQKLIMNGTVLSVEATEGYANYPDKPKGDLGGIFVAIGAHEKDRPLFHFSEGVLVFVTGTSNGPRIRELQWGMP